MEVIGLLIGIVGVVLTVAWLPPVVRWREKRKQLRKWSTKLQAESGIIGSGDEPGIQPRVAYSEYKHNITIDAEGGTRHNITARALNVSQQNVPRFRFCVYGDTPRNDPNIIRPWIRVRRTTLEGEIESWDSNSCSGVVALPLAQPLAPEAELLYHWGYELPGVFTRSDEYYNFDFGPKHFDVEITLEFPSDWHITYARWENDREGVGRDASGNLSITSYELFIL